MIDLTLHNLSVQRLIEKQNITLHLHFKMRGLILKNLKMKLGIYCILCTDQKNLQSNT